MVTAECIIGTGFLSEINASVADFWGTGAYRHSNKLALAKQNVLDEIKYKSLEKGGDAAEGLDVEVGTIGNNMLMVSATATAVKIEEIM